MNGYIFNIQKFCTNDGNGIRTVVFLKGCPLHCLWCHNPESQKLKPEISFSEERCIHCGRCEKLCPKGCHKVSPTDHVFLREKCDGCGKCAPCPAMELIGKSVSSESVIAEVLKDKVFYSSSRGGVTFSGGEPFFQFEFFLELLKLAKLNSLDVCVETSGYCSEKQLVSAAQYIDCFLFDYKLTDNSLHKRYVGCDNEIIIKNLHTLNELNKPVILRCPIIPNVNDNTAHFKKIGEIANYSDCVKEVQIEPYHSFGEAKYKDLGRVSEYNNPISVTAPTKECWLNEIRSFTNKKVTLA